MPRPGELFVVRNVANLAPPYGPDDEPHGISAAIEFAVRSLRVRDIVILGHAMCGGIRALLDGTPAETSDFVGQWVSIAEPARRRAMRTPPEQRADFCEHEAVRLSLDNLMTFPWIETAVDGGRFERFTAAFSISAPAFLNASATMAFFGRLPTSLAS